MERLYELSSCLSDLTSRTMSRRGQKGGVKRVYSDKQIEILGKAAVSLYGDDFLKFVERFNLVIRVFDDIIRSITDAMSRIAGVLTQYTSPEPVDISSLEEVFQKFEKGASTVLDPSLSPREYGERLSWGSRGHRYKSRNYPYIPLFKRNLPYQKRAG